MWLSSHPHRDIRSAMGYTLPGTCSASSAKPLSLTNEDTNMRISVTGCGFSPTRQRLIHCTPNSPLRGKKTLSIAWSGHSTHATTNTCARGHYYCEQFNGVDGKITLVAECENLPQNRAQCSPTLRSYRQPVLDLDETSFMAVLGKSENRVRACGRAFCRTKQQLEERACDTLKRVIRARSTKYNLLSGISISLLCPFLLVRGAHHSCSLTAL